jgi:ATP-dependent protease ClpP protease subunit
MHVTIFMLHPASIDLDGSVANVASTAKAEKDRCERMDRLLATYTKKDYRHWARFSKGDIDHYFDSEQAKEWGLVDHIWAEK